jgi:hypothetical protein
MATLNPAKILFCAALYGAALTGAAFAQQPQGSASGTTSGPASGTNVVPSTVTQKKGDSMGKATSSGAPGMSGPKGSENGPKPDKNPPK